MLDDKVAIQLLDNLVKTGDTLWIYDDEKRVFVSDKKLLVPLLEYIATGTVMVNKPIILDKVVGNAAALLIIQANAGAVFSILGSELAGNTLDMNRIRYRFTKTVPTIMATNRKDICPMEKLSLGKNPQEFYDLLKELKTYKIKGEISKQDKNTGKRESNNNPIY